MEKSRKSKDIKKSAGSKTFSDYKSKKKEDLVNIITGTHSSDVLANEVLTFKSIKDAPFEGMIPNARELGSIWRETTNTSPNEAKWINMAQTTVRGAIQKIMPLRLLQKYLNADGGIFRGVVLNEIKAEVLNYAHAAEKARKARKKAAPVMLDMERVRRNILTDIPKAEARRAKSREAGPDLGIDPSKSLQTEIAIDGKKTGVTFAEFITWYICREFKLRYGWSLEQWNAKKAERNILNSRLIGPHSGHGDINADVSQVQASPVVDKQDLNLGMDTTVREQFEQQIALLKEEDSTGRGRGPAQMFKGFVDGIKDLKTSFLVDFANKPPPRAKFDAMNYYTLDVRLTPPIAVRLMQNSIPVYTKAATEGIKNFITDTPPQENIDPPFNGTPNEIRVKMIIKKSFEDSMNVLKRSSRQRKRKTAVWNSMKENNVEIFDTVLSGIVDILLEASSPEDILASEEFIAKNNIQKGQKVSYTTSSGVVIPATVAGLPGDDVNGSIIPKNSIQLIKAGSNSGFAVNIIKNGAPTISISGATPSGGGTYGNRDVTEWNPAWNTMPLSELLKEDELEDIVSALPSFFISGNPKTFCIVSIDGFVGSICSALESAFRGAVKSGVTIEELIGSKFGTKVVNPEVGAFINRIKDPTSNKSIDFRAWNEDDLENLHNIIMHTFSDSNILDQVSTAKEEQASQLATPKAESVEKFDILYDILLNEAGSAPATPANPATPTGTPQSAPVTPQSHTLKGLVLYMTQKDFDKFVKGGQGVRSLVRGLGRDVINALNTSNV